MLYIHPDEMRRLWEPVEAGLPSRGDDLLRKMTFQRRSVEGITPMRARWVPFQMTRGSLLGGAMTLASA